MNRYFYISPVIGFIALLFINVVLDGDSGEIDPQTYKNRRAGGTALVSLWACDSKPCSGLYLRLIPLDLAEKPYIKLYVDFIREPDGFDPRYFYMYSHQSGIDGI